MCSECRPSRPATFLPLPEKGSVASPQRKPRSAGGCPKTTSMPVLPLKKKGPLGGASGGRSAAVGWTCHLKRHSVQNCSTCCHSGASNRHFARPSQGGWPQF